MACFYPSFEAVVAATRARPPRPSPERPRDSARPHARVYAVSALVLLGVAAGAELSVPGVARACLPPASVALEHTSPADGASGVPTNAELVVVYRAGCEGCQLPTGLVLRAEDGREFALENGRIVEPQRIVLHAVSEAALPVGARLSLHVAFPCPAGTCTEARPVATFTVGDAPDSSPPSAPTAIAAGATSCSSCDAESCACFGPTGGWDFRATEAVVRMASDAEVVHFDVYVGGERIVARARTLAVLAGRYHPQSLLEPGQHRADGLLPPGPFRVVAIDAAGNASDSFEANLAAGPCPVLGPPSHGAGGCSIACPHPGAQAGAPAPGGIGSGSPFALGGLGLVVGVAGGLLARRLRSRHAPRA